MYSFLLATVVVLLVAYCINRFASRMAASGSLYTFVARGLGPVPAMLCGVSLILGYGVLAMATLVLSGGYTLRLLPFSGAGNGVALMLGLASAAAVVMVRGVSVASRVTLAIEAAAIGAVVVVIAGLALRTHGRMDNVLIPSGAVTPGGFGAGVALAITAFIGFESAAALGPEARRPHLTVTRAIGQTVGVAGVIYLAGAALQLSVFPGGGAGLAATSTPLPTLAVRLGAPWLSIVLDLAIAASAFACTIASATALARLLFSMAREGVLPAEIGRTSQRFGTPHVAILIGWLGIVSIPLVGVASGISVADAFVMLVTVATFGYMLAYVLVCSALPAFLYRIGELTASALGAGVTATVVLCAVFGLYAVPSTGTNRALFVLSGAPVLIGTGLLVRRSRGRATGVVRLGLYDEPIAADLFSPSWRRAS
jgi:amino acid transporter